MAVGWWYSRFRVVIAQVTPSLVAYMDPHLSKLWGASAIYSESTVIVVVFLE